MSDGIWALMASATMATATAASASTTSTTKTEEAAESGLGRDAFMQLLLTQMQNQDPMNPMDGQEFFAQLAQLSLLEQMWQMNDKLQTMTQQQHLIQASAMIGKTVDVTDQTGVSLSGIVEGVRVLKGEVYLDVDGDRYTLDQVVSVH